MSKLLWITGEPQRRATKRMSKRVWTDKVERSMRQMVALAWPRWEKQLTGDLVTEKAACRRLTDELVDYVVGVSEGDGEKVTLSHRKEVRRMCAEAFRETRMDSAEVSLCKMMMDRLVPNLQQIEKKVSETHTHIVVLPEEKEPGDWGRIVAEKKALEVN